MSTCVLTPVVGDKIWICDRPVWFGGVRLRARSTVVRLEDGTLLLHTAPALTGELVEELRALGELRWLVVPNCWHHLETPAAAKQFPGARVVGPASALERNKALKIDVDIHGGELGEKVPEIEALPLAGIPFWDESVLYHRPTKTLIGADIVCWANENDHFSWRLGARVTGCYERVRVPPDARKKIVDKAAAAGSIQAMLERPAKRLIVGHGGMLGEDFREQVTRAYRDEGVQI